MSEAVPVLKDEENQRPIPSPWRSTLVEIVEAFKEGDYELKRGVPGVRPISAELAVRIARNASAYGGQLVSLPEATWETSACQWMQGYWELLVDLYEESGVSDLALSARVFEEGSAFSFEVRSVHVP